jgi:hypothetical protein
LSSKEEEKIALYREDLKRAWSKLLYCIPPYGGGLEQTEFLRAL